MDGAVPERESAVPVGVSSYNVEADVVVVGGGGAGLPVALFSRWLGNRVLVLEKAAELGGTARKAAFWFWVPNNEPMRALGIEDSEEDCLKYMARLSRPYQYDPHHATLGLSEWEHSLCKAIYESASPAVELLSERNALPYRHCTDVLDYWADLPEDKAPRGRVLVPRDACASMSDGGEVAIRTMSDAARRDGITCLTSHRVQRLIRSGGAVVGVEATAPNGGMFRVRAAKAVVFATGGFTHNQELMESFFSRPLYGGCAAETNEGDFVYISSAVGAQLRNMGYGWMCPIPLEKAVARRRDMVGMFSVAGDSMIFVDKCGCRVVNEKLLYNELAQVFLEWDPVAGEYPNLVLIQIWDQRSQDYSASDEYGRLIVPSWDDDGHVIMGETLDALVRNVEKRLERCKSMTGGLQLSEGFLPTLKVTLERFNKMARRGVDEDFGRGGREVELLFNGPVKEEAGRANPTIWPISETGPYYGALVVAGTLDTKGGPKTSQDGHVLDDRNRPIPGLYGVGNCVASPSAQAYWAGGATLGPIMALAYRTARAADAEPVKRWEDCS